MPRPSPSADGRDFSRAPAERPTRLQVINVAGLGRWQRRAWPSGVVNEAALSSYSTHLPGGPSPSPNQCLSQCGATAPRLTSSGTTLSLKDELVDAAFALQRRSARDRNAPRPRWTTSVSALGGRWRGGSQGAEVAGVAMTEAGLLDEPTGGLVLRRSM